MSGAAPELTTLFAPVPVADPAVAEIRAEHDWPARHGVPAHITLLGPFLPPDRITQEVLARLAALFGARVPVGFSLSELRRVGSIAYLAPEPDHGLRSLSSMLEDAFPDAPRYGDRFGGPLYHLTVARDCGDRLFAEIQARLTRLLPIDAIIDEAVLVEHRATGAVRTLARYRFGWRGRRTRVAT